MTLNAAHLSTKNLESVCILFCCASSVRRKIPRSPRFYLSVNTLEGTAWIPHKITKITVYLSSWWLKDYFNCQGLFHTKIKMKKKTFYRRSTPYSLHLDGDHCRQSSPRSVRSVMTSTITNHWRRTTSSSDGHHPTCSPPRQFKKREVNSHKEWRIAQALADARRAYLKPVNPFLMV